MSAERERRTGERRWLRDLKAVQLAAEIRKHSPCGGGGKGAGGR